MTRAPVRVVIATGATGGHLFPALSLIESIQATHPETEIHLLLNRMPDFASEMLSAFVIHVHAIALKPPSALFSFMAFRILIEYIKAFWKTAILLDFLKPKVIVGFGSFATVPAVLCGASQGIPIVLHEQNACAGRANQFLSRWADCVAVSFPKTGNLPVWKTIWTGFPVRSSFLKTAFVQQGEKNETFTVLVFGGSQGARRLNKVFLEVLERFQPEEKARFAVIHITGSDDFETARQAYQRLGIHAEVLPFSKNIETAFARADLVISRAGAGTIFELAAVGRAAILVPYPFAYAHQEVNARDLAERGWVRVLNDQTLTSEGLYRHIREVRSDADSRRKMANGIRELSRPDAARALREAAWKL